MPRTVRYWKEFLAGNGWTVRLEIYPAGAQGVSVNEVDEIEIPDEAGVEGGLGDGVRGWGKLLLGTMKPEELKLSMNLRPIRTHASADVRDLAGYLLKPRYDGGCTLTYGSYSRTMPTYTSIRVLHNGGSGSPTIVWGEYSIRRLPERAHDIAKGLHHIVEIPLRELSYVVLQNVLPADMEAMTVAGAGVSDIATAQFCWNWLYMPSSGDAHGHGYGQGVFAGGWYPKMHFCRLTDVYEMVGLIGTVIYRAYRRSTIAYFGMLSATSATVSGGDTGDGNPYDHITLYRQGPGENAETTGAALGRNDRLVCYKISRSDDATVRLAGFISSRSRVGLFKWKNAWDWINESAVGAGCKVLPYYPSVSILAVYFAMILEEDPASGGPRAFDTNQLPDNPKPVEGAGVIVGATATHPGAGSDDQSSIPFTADWGVESEEEQPITTVFSNCPQNGDGSRHDYAPAVAGSLDVPVLVVTPYPSFQQIFYKVTPSWSSDEKIIRAHHKTDIALGNGTTITVNHAITLPVVGPSETAETLDRTFWGGSSGLMVATVLACRNACIPYAVSKAVTTIFGGEYQHEVGVEDLPMTTDFDASATGGRIDVTDWPDGSVMADDGDTSLDHWPGAPLVRSVKYSLVGGTCSPSFLAVEDP